MLRLAGDADGLNILDVACIAGHYAQRLLADGASVTGSDGSAQLLEHAKQLAIGANFRLHDLERTRFR